MSESPAPSSPPPRAPRHTLLAVVLVLFVMAVIAGWGIFYRLQARAALSEPQRAAAIPTVAVKKLGHGAGTEDLLLPGTVQAYADAPIYARTSGYLKRWFVDIGGKVKAGQLLAEIDTPEIDQQQRQAQADLANAQANEQLARTTTERWKGLLATDSVPQQEADEKAGDYAAKKELTAAARANLQRLRDLQNFQRVIAPFDGTITTRNTDVGRLITSAGSELFHIADTRKLRVYVQVPQAYADAARPGVEAEVLFAEKAGRTWPAKIVRNADALDPATRTLQTELQLDNANGELLPGGYAEVRFKLPVNASAIRIPSNALLFRAQGLLTARLGANNHVSLVPIKTGRDFGTEIEVLSGLAPDDTVVINPPDSLQDGQEVRLVQRSEPAGQSPPADKNMGEKQEHS